MLHAVGARSAAAIASQDVISALHVLAQRCRLFHGEEMILSSGDRQIHSLIPVISLRPTRHIFMVVFRPYHIDGAHSGYWLCPDMLSERGGALFVDASLADHIF